VSILLATALVSGAPDKVAAASNTPTPLTWLAAGDSYSSGEGLPHSTGKCATAEPSSGSSTWAEQAFNTLQTKGTRLAAPDIVACTGATTDQFQTNADKGGSPEWSPSMGTYDLVTFTFGGDDIGFAPIIEQCLGLSRLVSTVENAAIAGSDLPQQIVEPLPSDPGHTCPSASIIEKRISALGGSATTPGSYRYFLNQVANTAVNPGGNIVVLGYPELIELPKFWAEWEQLLGTCWGMSKGDANELRGIAGDLNATIGQAVADVNKTPPNGVHLRFVDVNTGTQSIAPNDPHLFESSSGPRHNLCSSDPWINGLSTIDLPYGSFHPKQAGLDNEGALAAQGIGGLDWSGLLPVPTTTTTTTSTTTPPILSLPRLCGIFPGFESPTLDAHIVLTSGSASCARVMEVATAAFLKAGLASYQDWTCTHKSDISSDGIYGGDCTSSEGAFYVNTPYPGSPGMTYP
jgi:hypothetical protein